MLCSTGGNFYAGTVVGSACAFENTRNLTELTTNLLNHLLGSTTYSLHGESAEQEGSHSTDESTDEHLGVHQVHLEVVHEVGNGGLSGIDGLALDILHHHAGTIHRNLDFLDVRGEESEGRECSRTDGEALTRSSSGISKRVERVSTMTNLFAEFTHLSVTTGVVGNRSVSVGCQRNTQRREHSHSSDTDAVKSVSQTFAGHREVEAVGKAEAEDDSHTDSNHGDAGRNHTRAYTFNNNGGGTRQTSLRNFLGGLV